MPARRPKKTNALTAQQWNERYPTGTRVRFTPVRGRPERVETVTCSPAWELGHGDAVVSLEGRSGGCSLDFIEVIGVDVRTAE